MRFSLEYHWDCYDLKEVNSKSIGNYLGQVSVDEIRDAESNSDNSQIEISNEDLEGRPYDQIIIPNLSSAYNGHNHSPEHQTESALSSSSNKNNSFDQGGTTPELPSSLLTEVEKSLTPSSSEEKDHLDPRRNQSKSKNTIANHSEKNSESQEIDSQIGSEKSSKNSASKYLAHLDQYLSVHQKNSSNEAFQKGDEPHERIKILSSTANDNPSVNSVSSQQPLKGKDIRRKPERRFTTALEALERNESEIKSVNRFTK